MFVLLFFVVNIHSVRYLRAQSEKPVSLKDNSVQKAVNALSVSASYKNSGLAFYAIDIMSGEVIAEKNPDLSLLSASVMKMVTTATALEVLGPAHRFSTVIEYDGAIDSSGTLNGNLYIKGGGDPTLGSHKFESYYYKELFWTKWADAVKKAGIDSINGSVVGDARIFTEDCVPLTWQWNDIGNYYGAGPCGLSIYDNICFYYFKSGKAGEQTTLLRTDPVIRDLKVDNQVLAANIRSDQAYIFGSAFSGQRSVRGSIPAGRDEFEVKGSLPDPAFQCADDFSKVLKSAGIGCAKEPQSMRRLRISGALSELPRSKVAAFQSPTVLEIVNVTNSISFNLYAEHLFYQIGLKKKRRGDADAASDAVIEFLASKGINTSGMFIADGSGLSRKNGVTARCLVELLKYKKTQSADSLLFYNSLPIAGVSGTMRNFCKGTAADGNLRAKSGYIDRVRSYAGYVETKSKRKVAFAILINNYSCSASEAKVAIEKILADLAALDI